MASHHAGEASRVNNTLVDPIANLCNAIADDMRRMRAEKGKIEAPVAWITQDNALWCIRCFHPTIEQAKHCIPVRASDRGVSKEPCDICQNNLVDTV